MKILLVEDDMEIIQNQRSSMSRVLVIEDDEILNGGLCYNLQKRGITPFSAYTLEEAKGLLLKEAYDLIVLDVNLPDGSGFEFAQDTAALYEIPFIFLTAHNLEDEIIGGYHMGAEDYITKPFRIQIAMEKIQAVLRRCGGRHEESVNDIVHKAERKKVELSIRCGQDMTAVRDVKWTAEAIGNILDNAVKYTPEGGKISIDVSPGEMYTKIRVQDTGRGIASGHYNDIFKRFYRESPVSGEEGLGLGLYIARNIIMLQGGYIMVHSVLGQGSCFSVFLPRQA